MLAQLAFGETTSPDHIDAPFVRNAPSNFTVVFVAAEAVGTNATSAITAIAVMLRSFLIPSPSGW